MRPLQSRQNVANSMLSMLSSRAQILTIKAAKQTAHLKTGPS